MSKKATLRYFLEQGWIVVNSDFSFKLIYDNIRSFRLKRNDEFHFCSYYFNTFGDLCIVIDDIEVALSKSYGYEIEY